MEVSVAGLARIKQQNRIEDVVSERGITLKRKGRQLFALCPFHKEKSPSFCVTPGGEAGRFHCFGGNCGATGDVIGFLVKHEGVTFREAVKTLCQRSGLRFEDVVEETPKQKPVPPARKEKPTRAAAREVAASEPEPQSPAEQLAPGAALALVVDHYHRKLAEHPEALRYLQTRRGLSDLDLLRAHKVGVADGSLLKAVPKAGRLREQLVALGVITQDGRELLGGCIVVPIPDPLTGQWTTLYGRGIKSARHCYLPGPLRGVLNFQAAKLSEEIVLTESILDALSFHQAGVATAIPIYGTQGFLADHLDLLKREGVQRAILALDNDEPGRRAAEALKERLSAAGLAVRIASFPAGIKDANELLVSRNGDAGACFRQLLDEAEPKPAGPDSPTPATEPELDSAPSTAATVPADQLLPEASHPPDADPAPGESFASQAPVPAASNAPRTIARDAEGQITLSRRDITFKAHVVSSLLGRLRVTIKLARGAACHVDTLDLYASRARSEFARRAAKALNLGADEVEADLLALLVEAEKVDSEAKSEEPQGPPPMTDSERAEALAFLKCPDLLAQVARDIETLGFVGEDVNKRLLYLVAISRKLPDPLSAVILSQSGAGKSGLAEVIEKLTPPEDVVMLTRLTPQSLYYTEPGFLDRKLIIVEERHGSEEADYSIRVLQSRKKLIAAAPVKDPATGTMKTKLFVVEARAAFIEATTASAVNHENATRCFELMMDESVEQTRRVHERQRLLKTEAGLRMREDAEKAVRRHWNAQRLLAPLFVVIPFADQISFPVSWMRTRRDHARFLNLIEVSAFLHQHQRERTREGAVVAAVSDYAAAYGLAQGVLSETFADVKKPLRDAYSRIRTLCEQQGSVSRRAVREELSLPDSTVRRWLAELVDLEYLAVAEGSKGGAGRATRYMLAERETKPGHTLGLLTPAELAAKMAKR